MRDIENHFNCLDDRSRARFIDLTHLIIKLQENRDIDKLLNTNNGISYNAICNAIYNGIDRVGGTDMRNVYTTIDKYNNVYNLTNQLEWINTSVDDKLTTIFNSIVLINLINTKMKYKTRDITYLLNGGLYYDYSSVQSKLYDIDHNIWEQLNLGQLQNLKTKDEIIKYFDNTYNYTNNNWLITYFLEKQHTHKLKQVYDVFANIC